MSQAVGAVHGGARVLAGGVQAGHHVVAAVLVSDDLEESAVVVQDIFQHKISYFYP